MNRNSIGGDSSGLGGVRRRRRRAQKGRPVTSRPGIAALPAAAGAAFIVLTHLRVKSYCARSLPPPVPLPVPGGLRLREEGRRGHLRGRRPPP